MTFIHPNPDLEIFIYELPELLNNVIASVAKQSRFRLLRYARNDGILEFIKYFLNRDLGIYESMYLQIIEKEKFYDIIKVVLNVLIIFKFTGKVT